MFRNGSEFIDSVFMNWLAVEHRNVYDAVQEERQQAKEDEDSYVDLATLDADDMRTLMLKMRQAAMEQGGNLN